MRTYRPHGFAITPGDHEQAAEVGGGRPRVSGGVSRSPATSKGLDMGAVLVYVLRRCGQLARRRKRQAVLASPVATGIIRKVLEYQAACSSPAQTLRCMISQSASSRPNSLLASDV